MENPGSITPCTLLLDPSLESKSVTVLLEENMRKMENMIRLALFIATNFTLALTMTYFTIHKEQLPETLDVNNRGIGFSEIKTRCLSLGPGCRHGFVCHGKICSIVDPHWTGKILHDEAATYYKKVQVSLTIIPTRLTSFLPTAIKVQILWSLTHLTFLQSQSVLFLNNYVSSVTCLYLPFMD